jgi:hypothetical protein
VHTIDTSSSEHSHFITDTELQLERVCHSIVKSVDNNSEPVVVGKTGSLSALFMRLGLPPTTVRLAVSAS